MGGTQKIRKGSGVALVGLESAGRGLRLREVAAGTSARREAARRPPWHGGGRRCGRREGKQGGGHHGAEVAAGVEVAVATWRWPPVRRRGDGRGFLLPSPSISAVGGTALLPGSSVLEAPPSSLILQVLDAPLYLLSRWK
jgi:hypothetical protein